MAGFRKLSHLVSGFGSSRADPCLTRCCRVVVCRSCSDAVALDPCTAVVLVWCAAVAQVPRTAVVLVLRIDVGLVRGSLWFRFRF